MILSIWIFLRDSKMLTGPISVESARASSNLREHHNVDPMKDAGSIKHPSGAASMVLFKYMTFAWRIRIHGVNAYSCNSLGKMSCQANLIPAVSPWMFPLKRHQLFDWPQLCVVERLIDLGAQISLLTHEVKVSRSTFGCIKEKMPRA